MKASWLTLPLAALVATACVGSYPLVLPEVYRSGVPSRFGYAAGGRDLPTVIVGNPFAVSPAAFEAAVVGAMQGNNAGPSTRFVAAPATATQPQYRVVVMFDPPKAMSSWALCGDPAGLRSQPAGDLRAIAAFCENDRILSSAHLTAPKPASLDSPEFRRAIAALTHSFVPDTDPFVDLDV